MVHRGSENISRTSATHHVSKKFSLNTFLNAGKKVVFDDGAHIVYVNNKIKDDTPLGRLMHDFDCKNPDKMFYEIIADKVIEHKIFERSGYEMAGVIEKFILKLARIPPPLSVNVGGG